MSLRNKTVLITGGARGLGRAFAEAAVAAGAEVVIADIAAVGARHRAPDRRSRRHGRCLLRGLHQRSSQRSCERLDGLVNNAAITNSGGRTLEELDVETWDRVMAVNVRGTWLMTRACLPLLRRSKGKVVNIASDTAMWGAPKLLAYISSKGAVIAMTRGMARELGPDGITVNAIAPGLTEVEATEYVPEERHRHYLQGRALKRAQQPEDACGAVLFLLSEDAAFMTGQVIPVNGGFVMN